MLRVSGLLAVQLEVFLCCRTSPERGLSNGAMLALPWEQHGLDPGAGHGQPLDGMLNPHIPSGHGAKTSDPPGAALGWERRACGAAVGSWTCPKEGFWQD